GGGSGSGSGSGSDNPTPDVSITVRDGAMPQAGGRVVVQHAHGTMIADVQTDLLGLAGGVGADGRHVPVIPTHDAALQRPTELYTYLGVKKGDQLVFGNDKASGTPTPIAVTVPTGAQGTVDVVTPCGSGGGTAPTVQVDAYGCPANFDVFLKDA